MVIGERIRIARQQEGFKTQAELAKRMGVSQKQISLWENSTNIEWETLERIAAALKIDTDRLLAVGPVFEGKWAISELFHHEEEEFDKDGKIGKEVAKRIDNGEFPPLPASVTNQTSKYDADELANHFISHIDDIPNEWQGSYEDFVLALAQHNLRMGINREFTNEEMGSLWASLNHLSGKAIAFSRALGTPLGVLASKLDHRLRITLDHEGYRATSHILSHLEEHAGDALRICAFLDGNQSYEESLEDDHEMPSEVRDAFIALVDSPADHGSMVSLIQQLAMQPLKLRAVLNMIQVFELPPANRGGSD